MNKVTRADVDVQPYAFTTKALFVGHMDHRFLRWQVVDTPGILDRPLEERNTIEMQAITALAHLQCCVLYFLDISEQCGYPIEQQLKLFESIRPLFANKQVIIIANKIDVIPYESLSSSIRLRIEEVVKKANAELIPMSNISEENVSFLKTTACDKLLEARVDAKLSVGKVKDDVMARISVAIPKPRDNIAREAFIPSTVIQSSSLASSSSSTLQPISSTAVTLNRLTEKQLMWNNGGPGVYVCDYRKYYLLDDDEWKFDTIPEFMDGKNVMDFFDPEIEERLNALEAEEEELEANHVYSIDDEEDDDEINDEDMLLYDTIKEKQIITRKQSHLTKQNLPKKIIIRNRTEDDIKLHLESHGLDSTGVIENTRGRKRDRSISRSNNNNNKMDTSDDNNSNDDGKNDKNSNDRGRSKVIRSSSSSVLAFNDKDYNIQKKQRNDKHHRSQSATRGPTDRSVGLHQKKQVKKDNRVLERHLFKYAKAGEADREHLPKLVKHMNSGKRSLGTSTIGR